jgi:bifunctional non-homologous end joining protein LigD
MAALHHVKPRFSVAVDAALSSRCPLNVAMVSGAQGDVVVGSAAVVAAADLWTSSPYLRVRSRRGWDMRELVPELAALPVPATLDGELVAFAPDGSPDFPLVCERMLMRRSQITVVFVIFDLLNLDGRSLLAEPYSKRRAELETLGMNGVYWTTPEAFHDGPALFAAVCEHELEGVVAKRRAGRYQPSERG